MLKFLPEKIYALFDTPLSRRILSELSAIGAKIVIFPAVDLEIIENGQISEVFNNLTDFDWLIFPDIYAVEHFLQKFEDFQIDFFELDALRVCAYGESVADRLRYAQLHADVVPNNIKTSEVFQSLKNYIGDDLENLNFLVLRSDTESLPISAELKRSGAKVAELAIYKIIGSESEKTVKLRTLLKGGAVDEFIFTSPFDVLNLANLFPNENLSDVLSEVLLNPADNITEQSLREFRLI